MNDPKPTKHWDALAAELGATPPPEPAAQDSSTPSETPPLPDQPDLAGDASTPGPSRPKRDRPPRKPPKPTPQHWSALAGDLGLEIPPEPVPAASDTLETTPASDAERLAASEPDAGDATAELDDLSGPSQVARRSASLDVGFGIIATEDTRDPSFIEEAEDAVNEEEDDEAEDAYDEVDQEEEDSRPADGLRASIGLYEESTSEARDPDADTDGGTDLDDDRDETPASDVDGDAISEGAEAAPDTEDRSRRRKRRRGGRRRRRPDDETREKGDRGPESEASSSSDDAEQLGEEATEPRDTAAPDDRPARGRSRRGRRRRSGRTPAGSPTESSADEGDAPTGSGEEDDLFDGQDATDDSDVYDEASSQSPRDGQEGDEPEDDLEGGRPSHRKIPSWQEAIGVIVSGNMEDRSRSADDRPRGRGRGKGRRPNRGKKT